jgi:hypothetical protein
MSRATMSVGHSIICVEKPYLLVLKALHEVIDDDETSNTWGVSTTGHFVIRFEIQLSNLVV